LVSPLCTWKNFNQQTNKILAYPHSTTITSLIAIVDEVFVMFFGPSFQRFYFIFQFHISGKSFFFFPFLRFTKVADFFLLNIVPKQTWQMLVENP
jgi:hypothetical protein